MSNFSQIILHPIVNSIVQFPKANAFLIAGCYFSYEQFGRFISSIRHSINKLNTEDRIFALSIHDDIYTYAAIIALWMEGKAYVPLHPNQPLDRNLSILNQISPHYILDSMPNMDLDHFYQVICTSELAYSEDYLHDWIEVDEAESAYVLFTSGSTGIPKGVQISRHNLSSFIDSFWNQGYQLSSKDRCLQCFDLTFDLSVMSYLVPLLVGACVFTVPYNKVKWSYIYSLMDKYELTFAMMTPSTLHYFRPYFSEMSFPSMRYSLFCGEPLPTQLAAEWAACLPNAYIDNTYGPTEDTIFCTVYRFCRDAHNIEYNGILSIGKAVKNTRVIIVDENNGEVRESESGELCLSGEQLTCGYWNNPLRNEESFWTTKDGYRFYHTGDICFLGEGGNLLFVGRKDSQVKINGYRIELNEIEFHARNFLQKNVIVMTYTVGEENEIALFIEQQETDCELLMDYLKTKLPAYMIPKRIICEPVFPTNSSSKIDRIKLKQKLI